MNQRDANEYMNRLQEAIRGIFAIKAVDVTSHLERLEAECRELGIETEGKTYGQILKELDARRAEP